MSKKRGCEAVKSNSNHKFSGEDKKAKLLHHTVHLDTRMQLFPRTIVCNEDEELNFLLPFFLTEVAPSDLVRHPPTDGCRCSKIN